MNNSIPHISATTLDPADILAESIADALDNPYSASLAASDVEQLHKSLVHAAINTLMEVLSEGILILKDHPEDIDRMNRPGN